MTVSRLRRWLFWSGPIGRLLRRMAEPGRRIEREELDKIFERFDAAFLDHSVDVADRTRLDLMICPQDGGAAAMKMIFTIADLGGTRKTISGIWFWDGAAKVVQQ